MKRWLFLIFLGVIGSFFIRTYVVEGIYIASPSMEPALPVGSHYFVDKLIWSFSLLKRGDIIVFAPPTIHDKELVKRVIGLPGENIRIQEKKVFINGIAIREPYAQFKRANEILQGDNIDEMKIPADSYFVMGDNRDESGDSRDWKNTETGAHVYFIQSKDVKGKLISFLD